MFLEDVSSEPLWYVVHTYSGYEDKVKKSLETVIKNRGIETTSDNGVEIFKQSINFDSQNERIFLI